MSNKIITSNDYKIWLIELKSLVHSSKIKAKLSVNSQMIFMYWQLGSEIQEKINSTDWGSKLIEQLSKDLISEFPDLKGFSRTNLYAMKKFFEFYSKYEIIHQSGGQIIQQAAGQLPSNEFIQQVAGQIPVIIKLCSLIPWWHNVIIIEKIKSYEEVIFYINKTIENNWSRSVLEYQIESDLFSRQGKAITNFEYTLPKRNSDLAIEIMKDPYNFEFLSLKEKANERDFENKLVNHISEFLLELGKGFAYMGKQFNLKVGNKDYYLDLLFYHTKLKCYVIIELKIKEFEPEFIGKLNFYINAIDELVKDESDNSTIGILLCKNKDVFEVEFSLKGISTPIGVSSYRFKELPENLKQSLPSKEEFLQEIRKVKNDN
ncbi:MAG: PDDEXK nuclease domain-containing protein [Candidatus Kapabacteria bacterium]|nr:PDDEXK nuclease domain-containing protein [Candidatus Kapabacteria bacterium]